MRKTLQQLNIHNYFYYKRGQFNNITDVAGIKVGHSTINEPANVKTGVTAIIPTDFLKNELIGGFHSFNGNGEVTGMHYLLEEGRLTSPIFLTNTLSLGDVFSAVVDYYKGTQYLPIIAECCDNYLNDIEGRHVKTEHVIEAIESAKSGEIEQGCVGAGTGMASFGFKSGIGTASRVFEIDGKQYTVGVLVNNNIGSVGTHKYLRIAGKDVNKLMTQLGINDQDTDLDVDPDTSTLNNSPVGTSTQIQADFNTVSQNAVRNQNTPTHQDNSSILVITTDAPLSHDQLNRLAKHGALGMGRVGIVSGPGSGDFTITFSTGNKLPVRGVADSAQITRLDDTKMTNIFEAALEAIEESYLNSILTAETTIGYNGNVRTALPIDELLPYLKG